MTMCISGPIMYMDMHVEQEMNQTYEKQIDW